MGILFYSSPLRLISCFLVTVVAAKVTVTAVSSENKSSKPSICSASPEQFQHTPHLCRLLDWAATDVEGFATWARTWALQNGHIIRPEQAVIVPNPPKQQHMVNKKNTTDTATSVLRNRMLRRNSSFIDEQQQSRQQKQQLPIVLAHGMGDSCFNSGMQHVTHTIGAWLQNSDNNHTADDAVYSVCIPTGDTMAQDTKNGYFLNMDASVDAFAAKVRADPQLAQGFSAVGFSQGNNVIRGYIAHYNDPPVHTFLAVNGVNAGIGAVPYCVPSATTATTSIQGNGPHDETTITTNTMCDLLMEQASAHAYSDFVQEHSFQANYWRDPRPEGFPKYQKHGQLARWNNEAGTVNQTLRDNWARTTRFVWVLATQDGMIWPREGEHWGQPDPANPFHKIRSMKETNWYTDDLFGLRTADEAGKNVFESFDGDHLQFKSADLERWVKTYLKNT